MDFVLLFIDLFLFQYDEMLSKGNFSREDIVTMLTAHEGNTDAALQELNKAQLKPFLMRIWGQAEPAEVTSGAAGTADETSTIAVDTAGRNYIYIFSSS